MNEMTVRERIELESITHPIDFTSWLLYEAMLIKQQGFSGEYGFYNEPCYEVHKKEESKCLVKLFPVLFAEGEEGQRTYISSVDISIFTNEFPIELKHNAGGSTVFYYGVSLIIEVVPDIESISDLLRDMNNALVDIQRDTTLPIIITKIDDESVFNDFKILASNVGILMVNINNYHLIERITNDRNIDTDN